MFSLSTYAKDYDSIEDCVEDHGGQMNDSSGDVSNNQIIDKCADLLKLQEDQEALAYKNSQINICVSDATDEADENLSKCSKAKKVTNAKCLEQKNDFIKRKTAKCKEDFK